MTVPGEPAGRRSATGAETISPNLENQNCYIINRTQRLMLCDSDINDDSVTISDISFFFFVDKPPSNFEIRNKIMIILYALHIIIIIE